MKKIMLLFITVFMLSVLATCGSDSTGPEPQSENWMPLSVGNSWSSTIEGYSIDPAGPDTFNLSGSLERTVPAGSFANCGIIRETDLNTPDFQCDRYFHRDLGIVKDILVHGELQEIIFDLESFNVLYDP